MISDMEALASKADRQEGSEALWANRSRLLALANSFAAVAAGAGATLGRRAYMLLEQLGRCLSTALLKFYGVEDSSAGGTFPETISLRVVFFVSFPVRS